MATHRRPIRIGNCSGFFGDRLSALAEVVAEPDIDVVVGDYLAEVTMLVLAKTRAKQPGGGYAASFLRQIEPLLATIAARGIKVVTNAGGLNPHALGARLREAIAAAGITLSVAVVDGDDLCGQLDELAAAGHKLPHLTSGQPLQTWPHDPLTANAYLGGWGIAAALDAGADLVVTGRVTDASPLVGAAAWWHGWRRGDVDELAGAVVAGHLIECGTQVTGGNYSGFTKLDKIGWPSFPIADVAGDGSCVVTKTAGGGAVTVGTVTAQLLYEVGEPAYLNPDVVAHFDTLQLEPDGPNRVRVSGTSGSHAPATTKVAVTALGGYRNDYLAVLTGLDLAAKQRWFTEAVRDRIGLIAGIDAITFERLGSVAVDPATQGDASVIVRTVVTGEEQAVGRPFGAAIVELALANVPGFYGLSLPGAASSFGTYWPALIDQAALSHRVTLDSGEVLSIEPPAPGMPTSGREPARALAPHDPKWAEPGDDTIVLGDVADARSGDKGGDANVGVWVRTPDHWPWLRSTLTTERFRQLVPDAADLEVDRYEFANVHAVNFVVRGLLGEGATANGKVDSQAKALGEFLRARRVPAPRRPK